MNVVGYGSVCVVAYSVYLVSVFVCSIVNLSCTCGLQRTRYVFECEILVGIYRSVGQGE